MLPSQDRIAFSNFKVSSRSDSIHCGRSRFFIFFANERTFFIINPRRRTFVLEVLESTIKYGEMLEVLYMAKDGSISKRRIKVLQGGETSFRAYCFLRKSKRAFLIDNVLAAVPIMRKERGVI